MSGNNVMQHAKAVGCQVSLLVSNVTKRSRRPSVNEHDLRRLIKAVCAAGINSSAVEASMPEPDPDGWTFNLEDDVGT